MSDEMRLQEIVERVQPGRRIHGIAACLLPFEDDGRVAVEAFQNHLRSTHTAGLMNAVNMDTGYVNFLSEAEQRDVLKWTREALNANTPFVAGAYIEELEGEIVGLYRQKMDVIVSHGAIPIIFQTKRLYGEHWTRKVDCYRKICQGYSQVLAFELGKMFAPNGEIFDEPTVEGLMEIPELKGLKHSSLDRLTELRRLKLRDQVRPSFRIYSGNDLGINMVEYGSDYLLGLATFAPEKFAERDRLWESGDPAYFSLSDALQHLGNVAFRAPISAYKHSAAVFLKVLGRIPTDRVHARNAARPEWEVQIMADCAVRLGYEP